MIRLAMLCLVSVALAATAEAVTLRHNDLVATGDGGIIRIDGVTGARELIATGVGGVDIAVPVGAERIYSVSSSTLYEVIPSTGASRVVSSGFEDLAGVTVNGAGQVFVVDQATSAASGLRVPHVYEVDPASGASDLLFESALTGVGGTQTEWGALDAEMVTDTMIGVLGLGDFLESDSGCCYSGGAIIGYDLALGTESILVDPGEMGVDRWISLNGLGILPSGVVAASSDFDTGGVGLGWDPSTGDTVVTPSWGYLVDDFEILAGLWQLEFTSTPNGRIYVAPSGYEPWDGQVIGPEQMGVHLQSASGLLTDGKAFSQGGVGELQPVVIPEPSTLVLVGGGLVSLRLQRRSRRARASPDDRRARAGDHAIGPRVHAAG